MTSNIIMMNKREIFYALLAISICFAGLPACTKVGDTRTHALVFKPSASNTQASATKTVTGGGFDLSTSATMEVDGQAFMVYATYRQGSSDINVFNSQPQTVTYSTAGGTDEELRWIYYSPAENWIPYSNYKFRAIYPSGANVQSSSTSDRVLVDYRTGVIGAPDNYDLTVAYAERLPSTGGYGAVALNFKHALSAISIKVKYKDLITGNDKLTGLYIKGLIQAATLYYSGTTATDVIDWTHHQGINAKDKLYEWTATGTDAVFFDKDTKAAAFGGKYIFAAPQTISANQAAVYFTTEAGGTAINHGYLPAITWEAGKQYDYILSVSDSSVDIAVTVKPWTIKESGTEVSI